MKKTQLLLALLALSTGALAQDPNAATPADTARLALAREAIAAMQADKMFDGMAAQMKQIATQAATSALPADATPEQQRKVGEFQAKIMDLSMSAAKGMIAQMDRIYADIYSETELRAMKAFFTSPEGQSMIAKQPEVMQHVMPLVQQMQRDLMPKIQQLIQEAKAAAEAEKATAAPAETSAPQAAEPAK